MYYNASMNLISLRRWEGRGQVTPPFPITIVSRADYSDNRLVTLLSDNEREYFGRIPHHKRDDWLLGRMASKYAIQAYVCKVSNSTITLPCIEIVSGTGLPPTFILTSQTTLLTERALLTLSHSHGIAVAQVCTKNDAGGIGVDIERVRDFEDATLRAFLTEEEYDRSHNGLEPLPVHATLLWSIKEAYLKAIGVGLRVHPKLVEVVMGEGGQGYKTIRVNGEAVPVQIYWTTIDDFYIITNVIV